MIKRIAILTSGGDSPGMNATIRAVVKKAFLHNIEVYGVKNGYAGLVAGNFILLNRTDVGEKINRGGTFLGSARLEEFKDIEIQKKAVNNLLKYKIDALITIGGDGTYRGANELGKLGVNCIGLPGTIDNDIPKTDYTIGFNTALNTIVEAVDKLRDTSNSHYRCSVIEVMGRHCGDLALWAGLATGAEYIVIPEVEYNEIDVINKVKYGQKLGKKHFIIIITEKITDANQLAINIEKATNITARATVLGHIQRGGMPTAFDRVLASKLGAKAIEVLISGETNKCISLRDNKMVCDSFVNVLNSKRKFNTELHKFARQLD